MTDFENLPWVRLAWRAALLATLLAPVQGIRGDAQVTGNCWMEKVKGRPGSYVSFYEWNLYSSIHAGTTAGSYFRVGLPPAPARSYYSLTLAPGTQSLMLDEPLWWGRPVVYPGLRVPASGTVAFDIQPPTDYSCNFDDKSAIWGPNPWTSYGTTWYQSFVATGSSITAIEFRLAGTDASDMQVEVVHDTGGAITGWPTVGVQRLKRGLGGGDQWLRYLSNQVPTTPGDRYALKLSGIGGAFSIYRRLEDGFGYAGGQAYDASGTPQNFDLYAVVFSDNDGTVMSYANLAANDNGSLLGAAASWSQEVQAIGTGLAGASLYIGDGSRQVTFAVRSGSPTGPLLGPAKTGTSGPQASASIATVSWNPGEVPLTPGHKYYIQALDTVNPFRLTNPDSFYPLGNAWLGSTMLSGVGLYMQVLEWKPAIPSPVIAATPSSFARTLPRRCLEAYDSFKVANTGKGVVNYELATDVPWLTVDVASGAAGTDEDHLTVRYAPYALTAGLHTGRITVSGQQPGVEPKSVSVNVTITPPPFAFCDFDMDADVDQEDFGRFQTCLTGLGNPQLDPACAGAKLDDDDDVDQADVARFLDCLAGPHVTVATTCSDR